MDPIKQIQQRERRAKAKAEWAKIENSREEKRKLDILIKKDHLRVRPLHFECTIRTYVVSCL
jgi:hypothetical protein